MTLYKNKYRSETIRLKNWDYSSNGYYFITICTKNKECFLGEIINNEIILSDTGKIAYQNWLDIPNHFNNIEIDEFVIMPNHVHGIIIINVPINDIQPYQQNKFSKPVRNSLSMIINQFKGSVKRHCNKNNMFFEWQPRFYDQIIQEEKSLWNIRTYIKNNPINWINDENNIKESIK